MRASQNNERGISLVEIILIIILVVIVLMIIWALLGPSVQQWYSEFWTQISQPTP